MAGRERNYDFIIFGASGFTGHFVVEELAKAAKREEKKGEAQIKWAVAGRNEKKLQECLSLAQSEVGFDLGNVMLIKVDVSDKESIDEMTKQATVVLNCVGPYQLHGNAVVQSCIRNGASQLDLSGELQYINEIRQYDEDAKNTGVHIISSCGFDCVPNDVGLCYLSNQFPGVLNSAVGFIMEKGTMAALHTGTMESNILVMSNQKNNTSLSRKLCSDDKPKPVYPLIKRYGLHKNEDLSLWAVPFPAGGELINESQQYISKEESRPFIQYQGFLAHKSPMKLIVVAIGVAYFFCMAFFSLTRRLLRKYPDIMTAGVFSKQGATRESLKRCGFSVTLVGEGWKDSSRCNDKSYPPDYKMALEISGPDPGYRATSIMMVACGMTLLREKEKCSQRGGIMPPGMAFYKTNIIDYLTSGGISVKIKNI